jgi:hypothetical protein
VVGVRVDERPHPAGADGEPLAAGELDLREHRVAVDEQARRDRGVPVVRGVAHDTFTSTSAVRQNAATSAPVCPNQSPLASSR